MEKQHGFIGIKVMITILVMVVVGGAAAYYVAHNQRMAPTSISTNTDTAPGSGRTTTPTQTYTKTNDTVTYLDNRFTCYAKNTTSVYLITKHVARTETFTLTPGTYQQLPGADPATFKEVDMFDICFAADKNQAYQGATVLPDIDAATFSLLWYVKPGPVLFFRNASKIIKYTTTRDALNSGSLSVIPNADPATFKKLNGAYDFAPWAKDVNNVYCEGNIVPGADPATTQVISVGGGQTYLQVYVQGKKTQYDSGCDPVG